MAFTAQFLAQLDWLYTTTGSSGLSTDTTQGDVTLNRASNTTEGSGVDQVNAVYAVSGTLASGASISYDLQSLTKQIVGGNQTINFSKIKGLMVLNNASGENDNLYVGGGTNPFTAYYPSGSNIVEEVAPFGCFYKVNNLYGWSTSSGSKTVYIYNPGSSGGIGFEFGVIGVSG